MNLIVIGVNHQTAPVEVREQFAIPEARLPEAVKTLVSQPGIEEAMIVSTCNRVELIARASDANADLHRCLPELYGFDTQAHRKYLYEYRDRDAVRHVFRVASSLDSMVVGEPQILGQVKEAYATAQSRGSTGPVLNRVFQKGFQAAKHVRTQTAITEGQVSIANVAVELALTIFGSIADTRILLLGAGEIGEKTAKAFQSRGAAALTVASRTFSRAMELATTLGASAMPFEQHEARLAEFDIVVCATSAPGTVVSLSAADAAIRKRPARPLFFIDLALPRDVDAAAAELQNVFLYNLDDLAKIAEENRAAREAEISKCRTIVVEKAEALWRQVEAQVAAISSREGATPPPAEKPA